MKKQVRVSIDAKKWEAAEAAAKALGMTPSQYVEHVLTTVMSPAELISNAARIASDFAITAADTNDRIRIISDFIVDLYRARREGEV